MGMLGSFLLVEDATIDDLAREPATVDEFLRKRVHDVKEPVDYLDVDKAWHALHFFLTGDVGNTEPPLDFILGGGMSIGEDDDGYGKRAMRHSEVVELSRALANISVETLFDRYDPELMDEYGVYPSGWVDDAPLKPEERAYYAGAFESLRALVAKGAETGRGLLIWVW